MTLWADRIRYYPANFVGHRHYGSEDTNDFSLSRDLTRSRDQWVMGLYGQVPIKETAIFPSLVAMSTVVVKM